MYGKKELEMLISKTVMVRWNGFTRKWYEEKGYVWTKNNDYFECKIEDVQINSTVKVQAKCDYCGEIFNPEYRQLLDARKIVNKDCCNNRNCMVQKSREVSRIKYGVDNYSKTETSKEHNRKIFQTPFSEVEKHFQEKDLILLSKESDYLNDRSRLFFICNNHKEFGEQETNYANIKKNKGCCNYGKGELCAESSRLDGNEVYQAFINKGVIPKFKPEDYKNYSIALPFVCPDHVEKGIQYRNYASLQVSKHKCNYCSQEYTHEILRTDRNDILEYYELRGLIVENINEYENKDKPIGFRCPKHSEHLQQVSFFGLKDTKEPCIYCRIEKSLTKLNQRLRNSITQWSKKSKNNCNNKCIFTGSKKFDVHHLKSFSEIVKEALNELNYGIKNKYNGEEYLNIKNKVVELHNKYPLGVCIYNKIHILFHQIYTKEASIEDFYEFKKRYELGEFDELLIEVS